MPWWPTTVVFTQILFCANWTCTKGHVMYPHLIEFNIFINVLTLTPMTSPYLPYTHQKSLLGLAISQLWFHLCCIFLVSTWENLRCHSYLFVSSFVMIFTHILMLFPFLGLLNHVRFSIWINSRFYFDNFGHHAHNKLLNEPTNNVKLNFYNLNPLYL
jgi:hypothetical protein